MNTCEFLVFARFLHFCCRSFCSKNNLISRIVNKSAHLNYEKGYIGRSVNTGVFFCVFRSFPDTIIRPGLLKHF